MSVPHPALSPPASRPPPAPILPGSRPPPLIYKQKFLSFYKKIIVNLTEIDYLYECFHVLIRRGLFSFVYKCPCFPVCQKLNFGAFYLRFSIVNPLITKSCYFKINIFV